MTAPTDPRNDPQSTAALRDNRLRALAVMRAFGQNDTDALDALIDDLLPPLPKIRDPHKDTMGAVMDEARRARALRTQNALTGLIIALAAVAESASHETGYLSRDEWDTYLAEQQASIGRADAAGDD